MCKSVPRLILEKFFIFQIILRKSHFFTLHHFQITSKVDRVYRRENADSLRKPFGILLYPAYRHCQGKLRDLKRQRTAAVHNVRLSLTLFAGFTGIRTYIILELYTDIIYLICNTIQKIKIT